MIFTPELEDACAKGRILKFGFGIAKIFFADYLTRDYSR